MLLQIHFWASNRDLRLQLGNLALDTEQQNYANSSCTTPRNHSKGH